MGGCHDHKMWQWNPARCQNPTLMKWDPGFTLHPALVAPSLLVGEWRCPGEPRPWTPERTRYWEIAVQLAGTHRRRAGGEQYVVDPLLVTLHPAGDEYLMASPGGQPQRSTILLLQDEAMEELASGLPARTTRLSAAAAVLHYRMRAARDPVAVEEFAWAFLRRTLADAAGREAAPTLRLPPFPWRRMVEEIQQLIAARHREKLTLAEIARGCGASPSHASRVFRAVTGQSIHEHLRAVRLRVALHELSPSAGELTRLALQAGFCSHSHFTQAFRAEFGTSPSALRRSAKP